MDKKAVKQRLRLILDELFAGNFSLMARELGWDDVAGARRVMRSIRTREEGGTDTVSHQVISALTDNLLIRKEWLIDGEGEMRTHPRLAHALASNDVRVLTQYVDSMEPEIEAGSRVQYLPTNKFVGPSIYVLESNQPGHSYYLIANVSLGEEPGTVCISFANSRYKPVKRRLGEDGIDSYKILGLVVDWS